MSWPPRERFFEICPAEGVCSVQSSGRAMGISSKGIYVVMLWCLESLYSFWKSHCIESYHLITSVVLVPFCTHSMSLCRYISHVGHPEVILFSPFRLSHFVSRSVIRSHLTLAWWAQGPAISTPAVTRWASLPAVHGSCHGPDTLLRR